MPTAGGCSGSNALHLARAGVVEPQLLEPRGRHVVGHPGIMVDRRSPTEPLTRRDVDGLVAAEDEVLAVDRLLGELEGREPLGERLERLLALEAGQRGAEAVVDAVAEGEVLVVGPA